MACEETLRAATATPHTARLAIIAPGFAISAAMMKSRNLA